jgi:hypothetical protein
VEAEKTVLNGVFHRVEIRSEFPAVHKEWLEGDYTKSSPAQWAGFEGLEMSHAFQGALEKYLHEHKPLERRAN